MESDQRSEQGNNASARVNRMVETIQYGVAVIHENTDDTPKSR